MNEKYCFDQTTPIVIYGAATEGHILIERLQDKTSNIVGFIDRRATEINEIKGFPVFDLHSEELKHKIDTNTVVVIAVKNVFDHRSIAYQLYKELKLKKIILIPVNISCDCKEEIENVYNDLFYRTIRFPYSLSEITVDHLYEFKREDYRIDKGSSVVLPIPIAKVYTNKASGSIWNDINIAAYFPHIRLFQLFAGDPRGNEKSYMDFCRNAASSFSVETTEKWEQNVIDNRKRVYDEMRMNYELDRSFFYEHPSKGIWNPDGKYFNITDGKHRAIFQASMGCCFIPLEISVEDETTWLDTDSAYELYLKLEADLSDHCRVIDNPYFYRRLCQFREIDTKIFVSCVTLLSEMLFERYHVIDFSRITVSSDQDHENDYIFGNLLRLGCLKSDDDKNNNSNIQFHIGKTPVCKSVDLLLSDKVQQNYVTVDCYTMINHGKRHNIYLLKGIKP